MCLVFGVCNVPELTEHRIPLSRCRNVVCCCCTCKDDFARGLSIALAAIDSSGTWDEPFLNICIWLSVPVCIALSVHLALQDLKGGALRVLHAAALNDAGLQENGMKLQGDHGGLRPGLHRLRFVKFPWLSGFTVATYCSSSTVQHPKSMSTQTRSQTTRVTL